MPLEAFEIVDFGGVDSRSNPINMPQNRGLRCLNWVPKQDGEFQLRWGYAAETMSAVVATPIHTLLPFQSWDATKKYLITGQGTSLKIHDLSANTDTAATIRGSAIASSAKWNSYNANNRLHLGNGTDQKFFDGTTFRDNGLRAPTAAEIANGVVTEGVRELNSTENGTITLTAAAGGTFPATTNLGFLFYVSMFDTSTNELGPSTLNCGAGRVTVTLNQKVTVASMPVPTNANWIKLISRSIDSGANAYFCTNTSTAIVSCTRSGTTLTVIATGHGLSTGDIVSQSGTTNFDKPFKVTLVDANTYTVTLAAASGANTTGGTVKRIVSAANATTSVDVTSPAQDTSFIVNSDRGLPASVVGGANPGYQFYGCIYNPITQHVGNRIAIGGRYAPTYRVNLKLTGLPDYSGTDSEWQFLIGRTGDGAQVPYVVIDPVGNFISAISGQTSLTITQGLGGINGALELPTRNGVIPSKCTMFAHVGDKCYAADPGSPTIRYCGSQDNVNNAVVLGCAEQSWSPDDIETFPTAQAVTGIDEVDYELFVGTQNDTAILSDLNGQNVWKGPWNVGLAGPRAKCKAMPYGFFWLSGDKQLCTMSNGMPTPISQEYELAELAQLGDAYLSAVELVYYRDASKAKDEIRIEGRLADGTPYTVIHDFKLRDARSQLGQGYSSQFTSALASAFTVTQARDANGKIQIYAGASTGQIYRLYSGADDAGTQYNADAIFLVNAGTERPDIPFLDWFGDGNTIVSIGKTLSTSLAAGSQFPFEILNPQGGLPQSVQGAESDSLWRVFLSSPEIQNHVYIRFQLTSHSADGNLSFNSPPHVPLETYGRIYELVPVMGEARGK